jgi:hypothetical protein
MNVLERRIGWLALLAAASILAFGCSPREGSAPKKDGTMPDEDPPPLGGKLFAVPGHKYHGELVIVEKDRRAALYLYDKQVRNLVPTKTESLVLTIKNGTPVQITLKADRQETDPKDAASRFSGAHERLGTPVDIDKVEISGLIEGKSYVFTPDKD